MVLVAFSAVNSGNIDKTLVLLSFSSVNLRIVDKTLVLLSFAILKVWYIFEVPVRGRVLNQLGGRNPSGNHSHLAGPKLNSPKIFILGKN